MTSPDPEPGGGARPPRIAQRLLAATLGQSNEARSIRGDLDEDFARYAVRHGGLRARLWYWREAVALAIAAGPGRTWAALHDAHYAIRAVRRDPGFVVFASLIVGLGIGATTAVFSVISPLLLRPLPFEDPERLVWIANDGGPAAGLSAVTSRTSNLNDFREQARSFEGLAGFNAFFDQARYNLGGDGVPEQLVGVGVTDDFLDVLGVEPVVGRDFVPEEGVWDGRAAVMLSHGLWRRRFAEDPGIVGRAIILNDRPVDVVGVLPSTFDFSSVFSPSVPVDILVPFPVSPETDEWGNTAAMVGRLRPGVSVEAAQAELANLVAGLQEAEPDRWGLGARVTGLQDRIAGPFRAGMMLLGAAAGLVLLIVCVNLSNMLLSRSPRRVREMAVRRSLGATRGRLVRQLLIESLVVAALGAAIGLGVAHLLTRLVARSSALALPLLDLIAVDGAALAFTALVALIAGLGVGVYPALQVSEGGEAVALTQSSRGSTSGRRGGRLREWLVVAEVAMACVLLVVGGLVLRSFERVMEVELGFDPGGAVAWQLNTTRSFETRTGAAAFYDRIVEEVLAIPGVESAGLIDALPLGTTRTWSFQIVGVDAEVDEWPQAFPHIVDHRYLTTLGVPLVRGRHFSPDDGPESALVAMVNETAARTLFPDGRALGHMLRTWNGDAEVVGVVADVRHQALELASGPEVYFPYSQMAAFNTLDLVIRSPLPIEMLAGPVGGAIRRVDPNMPTTESWTLEATVERSVSPRRFTSRLLAAFAGSALFLAALGIYGVLSYSVTERVPEIGIRMALGESSGGVLRRLIGRTVWLATLGVAIGTTLSLAGARFLGSLLYGVEPTDPVTLTAMVVVLMAVAILSASVPAIRASRTDAAVALRSG